MDSLVLGVRDFSDKNVPTRSKFGNVITRNVLYSFVGQKVSDTQTGLRAMSLDIAKNLIAVSILSPSCFGYYKGLQSKKAPMDLSIDTFVPNSIPCFFSIFYYFFLF